MNPCKQCNDTYIVLSRRAAPKDHLLRIEECVCVGADRDDDKALDRLLTYLALWHENAFQRAYDDHHANGMKAKGARHGKSVK